MPGLLIDGKTLTYWLIVVIGGIVTLYGAVIGSVLFVPSYYYFPAWVVGRLLARVKAAKA